MSNKPSGNRGSGTGLPPSNQFDEQRVGAGNKSQDNNASTENERINLGSRGAGKVGRAEERTFRTNGRPWRALRPKKTRKKGESKVELPKLNHPRADNSRANNKKKKKTPTSRDKKVQKSAISRNNKKITRNTNKGGSTHTLAKIPRSGYTCKVVTVLKQGEPLGMMAS